MPQSYTPRHLAEKILTVRSALKGERRLRTDYTAVGDTTNLAARLQQLARPGSLVISEATHRLVAGFFETLDLGEVSMKGRAPARVFEVLHPHGRRGRIDVAIERGLTPLVGREGELATLLDCF